MRSPYPSREPSPASDEEEEEEERQEGQPFYQVLYNYEEAMRATGTRRALPDQIVWGEHDCYNRRCRSPEQEGERFVCQEGFIIDEKMHHHLYHSTSSVPLQAANRLHCNGAWEFFFLFR